MSRIAKAPVVLPNGVEIKQNGAEISVKGPKGSLSMQLHQHVALEQKEGSLQVSPRDSSKKTMALAGTMRSLLNNLVQGVTEPFVKKLELRGVGYRVQVQGNALNLTLGFSHPVKYQLPEGVKAEAPSQTELHIVGVDKQRVGQVAAEVRAIRPPEPYKGKGVRYADEHITLKETKKK